MATVTYIPGKKQSLGAMKGVMDYVRQEKKTRDPVTGQRFVTGVHCLGDNARYAEWGYKKDGASQIARLLFEEATDINFYVGRAVNPAHQNPNLPINFNIKMRLVDELSTCLKQMGKRIKVSYF